MKYIIYKIVAKESQKFTRVTYLKTNYTENQSSMYWLRSKTTYANTKTYAARPLEAIMQHPAAAIILTVTGLIGPLNLPLRITSVSFPVRNN